MATVSVIIPSYNHAHFVKAAIQSALAQTYPDVEIIVVDDGSTDDTAQVVAKFGQRVRYIWQKNQGLSAARNTGIRHSRGDYIGLLDADDLWMPTFLEESVSKIEQNSNVGLTYTWWSHIDEYGDSLPEPGYYNQRGDLLLEMALMNHFPPVSVLVRKQGIEEAGYFDENLMALEDWDLWLRLAANGWRFEYIPKVLAQYRRHGNNMTLDVNRMEKNQLAVVDKLEKSAVASQVGHLLPYTRANVYLNSALSYHLQGKQQASYKVFSKAIKIWPPLLEQEETWYRWICADQPPGYQDTSHFKDLDQAAERIHVLLAQLFADPEIAPLIEKKRSKIEHTAGIMLANHYYMENNTTATRRQLLTLLRQSPSILTRPQATRLLLKSFLGQRGVAGLRGVWLPFQHMIK